MLAHDYDHLIVKSSLNYEGKSLLAMQVAIKKEETLTRQSIVA